MVEETPNTKLIALNEIDLALSLRSNPTLALRMLSALVRDRDETDTAGAAKHAAALKRLQDFGAAVEIAANSLPLNQSGRLRDFTAQKQFASAVIDWIASAGGERALQAAANSVRAEAAAEKKTADDARHEDERRELAQREARLADEIAAMDPIAELNKIAAAGVALSLDRAGVISAVPSGRLTTQQRRMIESRRDRVVQLLEQRQHAETL